ncbi:MAG: transporter substrate-binding domain-containing protein [Armatimonadetes bacterium]|nr:transporter substrate-binding domain-containing protein [Armatimonadota bacterium]
MRIGRPGGKATCALLALLASLAVASAQTAPARLVVTDDRSYPPFAYLDADGRPRGITVDIWQLWSRRSGVPVEFRLQEWDAALAALRQGKADVVGGMFRTPQREAQYDFTRQLLSIPSSIFFDQDLGGIKDATDLAGFRVGVVKGDSAEEYLPTSCPKATLVSYGSTEELVAGALAGDVKILVADAPVVLYYLAKSPGGARFRQAGASLASNRQCAAVRKGNRATLDLVNAGFARISQREIDAIVARWSGRDTQNRFPWRDVGIAAAAVLAMLAGSLAWNLTLSRRVAVATRVLNQRNTELEQSHKALLDGERELREGEARYRSVVENIQDVYYRTDREGRLSMISPSGARLLGYESAEAMVGRPNQSFWHVPEQRERFLVDLSELGAVRDYEVDLEHTDGSVVPVATTSRLIRDEAGQVAGVEGIFRDIAERRRADAALRESEARFRGVFENAPYAIAISRLSDGQYVDVNQAFADSLGLTRAQCLSLRSSDLSVRANSDQDEGMARAMRGEAVRDVSVDVVAPDGTQRSILFSTAPVVLGDERCAISIVVDVTDRKQAEREQGKLRDQLAQAQKMDSIGRLAGGVAHDFNNMLGVIIGHAEFALLSAEPGSPLHHDLTEIRGAAERSADLTRQLLAFARRQTVAPRLLDLNDTVAGMLRMLRRLIGENIELAWLPGANLGAVHMDPSQMDQILANLCVNARDAIGDTGRVSIETSVVTLDADYCALHTEAHPGDYVLLSVSDTGHGMDAQTRARVFEPFFTTKEVGRGTGLGLATVYGIVRQNDGLINVYSEPGQGTTFRIYLPRTAPADAPTTRRAAMPPPERGSETVLLVEDEPSVLSMASMMLERQGYLVLAAGGPEEALRLAAEHEGAIHLLLTDVVMPEMNGRDLATHLQARYTGLKCLFMSGYTAGLIAHHGVLDEGVPFIEKPFTMSALAAQVRAVLDSTRSGGQALDEPAQ